MERTTLFVDVLLPLNLSGYYTYRVPFEQNNDIKIGQRVVVQFRGKKLYSALVRRIHTTAPQGYAVKYILSILDENPIVSEMQFKFWEWIAQYYMCCPGNIMAAALPSAFRLASESAIVIHPDFDGELSCLNEHEKDILNALLQKNKLTVDEAISITQIQKIFPLLKTMIEKKIIVMDEELQLRYKPKLETYISLHPIYAEEQKLKELFESLEEKKSLEKQLNVLLLYFKHLETGKNEIKQNILSASEKFSASALNTLVKKEVLKSYQKKESRLQSFPEPDASTFITLNAEQQEVFDKIGEQWNNIPVTLIHGVTSSGKTEVYIKLIEHTLKSGKQVLYLLPEIALTVQIINRLKKYFGNKVGVYHSRYSENERAEIWNKTADTSENGFQIVIGARSALFLPFHNLGLVIVDEEHDTSFKQYEPAPRYNARDAAIYLAHSMNAKTILGSATPSIESYHNATEKKYQLVELKKRYGGILMPEIFVADMKEAHKRKEVKSHFSLMLLEHIEEALKNKEQVILFQNRRGFSVRIECDKCHWVPECKNCDVSLVYHKNINLLRCHYCGYTVPIPETCPACTSHSLKMKGFGTEKIEEELSIFFPEAHIARMDLDSTRSKQSHMQIITDFEDKKIDILVGTQMVTKGLDFDNVSIVGVLNADNMLMFPDFRAFERSYQQLAQVSGRAGRKGKRGKVIIQSFMPYHEAIRNVIDNNYLAMFNSQVAERKVFHYPPFYKLIKITLKHKDEQMLNAASTDFANELRKFLNDRILGPEYPLVPRVRNFYLKNIIVKLEQGMSPTLVKNKINELCELFLNQKTYSGIYIVVDVDPY